MFKRIEKRRRRQEEEEKLGLDGDMKELLGMHDTDSDESDSFKDSDEGQEGSDADVQDDEDDDGEVDSHSEDGEEGEDTGPPMSIAASLKDPIYSVSLESEAKACIACPGKLLKHATMAEVHKESQAHIRRYTRYIELAKKADPDDDVRDIVRAQNFAPRQAKEQQREDLSKRAQKRKEKQANIKAKREKQKAMKAKAKARKEAKIPVERAASGSPRPQKKRKVEASTLDQDSDSDDPSSPKPTKAKAKASESRLHAKRPPSGPGKPRRDLGEKGAASVKGTRSIIRKKKRA
ncbi:hypothetical protein B0H21DRAFT_819664 [Amylocystis lapponica]|nr:hypothetical protein B0H21DRAFT_819664 [Amylocystis lapponica]